MVKILVIKILKGISLLVILIFSGCQSSKLDSINFKNISEVSSGDSLDVNKMLIVSIDSDVKYVNRSHNNEILHIGILAEKNITIGRFIRYLNWEYLNFNTFYLIGLHKHNNSKKYLGHCPGENEFVCYKLRFDHMSESVNKPSLEFYISATTKKLLISDKRIDLNDVLAKSYLDKNFDPYYDYIVINMHYSEKATLKNLTEVLDWLEINTHCKTTEMGGFERLHIVWWPWIATDEREQTGVRQEKTDTTKGLR